MKKVKTLVSLAATALAALFIASTVIEPATARDGKNARSSDPSHSYSGRAHRGGNSARSFSGSSHSYRGRARSGGTRRFYSGRARSFRSPSHDSSRTYAYTSQRHGHRHHRHRRDGVFVYSYPYYYDYYTYSDNCAWLHRRALATGSRYWWNRYYDCIDDDY
jgi:hypothetical protein